MASAQQQPTMGGARNGTATCVATAKSKAPRGSTTTSSCAEHQHQHQHQPLQRCSQSATYFLVLSALLLGNQMVLLNRAHSHANGHLSKHDDMDSYLEDKLGDILKQVERGPIMMVEDFAAKGLYMLVVLLEK